MEATPKATELPTHAIANDWMNDAAAKAEFDNILIELNTKLKPIAGAMEASERLSEEDFAIMINARG